MSKLLSIGQIFRQGILKNHKGEPYKDKATVGRIVSRLPHKIVETPFGPSKMVSIKDLYLFTKKKMKVL